VGSTVVRVHAAAEVWQSVAMRETFGGLADVSKVMEQGAGLWVPPKQYAPDRHGSHRCDAIKWKKNPAGHEEEEESGGSVHCCSVAFHVGCSGGQGVQADAFDGPTLHAWHVELRA
jgi:hypothetical protein